MKKLILHSITMRRVQSLSLVLTIAFSVMTILALSMVYFGVQAGVALNEERSGAELMVVPQEAMAEIGDTSLLFTGAPAPYYYSDELYETIAASKGIECITTQFFSQTLNASCCSANAATRLVGVDFATDWTIQPYVSTDLSEGLTSTQVIVGSGVGGSIGSEVKIFNKNYTIVDRLEASGSGLDNSILLDIEVARTVSEDIKGLQHLWQKYGPADTLISSSLIMLDDEVEPATVINRINALEGVTVLQRSSVVESAQQQLEAVFAILLGVGLILIVTTIVQLFARFYSCVWDRKDELALYRAVGASKRDLKTLIRGELLLLMALGIVGGLVLGFVLYVLLLNLLQGSAAFPFVAPEGLTIVGLTLAILVVFLLLGLLALIAPLSQIARLEPAQAMQQGDID